MISTIFTQWIEVVMNKVNAIVGRTWVYRVRRADLMSQNPTTSASATLDLGCGNAIQCSLLRSPYV